MVYSKTVLNRLIATPWRSRLSIGVLNDTTLPFSTMVKC